MSVCEMDKCQAKATHTVVIAPLSNPEESWLVCRPHDRDLKRAFVRASSALPPPTDTTAAVRCQECDRALSEASGPCPGCGSLDRAVVVGDTATASETVRVRSKNVGKGGWAFDLKSGDSYTRDLKSWGRRELLIDHAQNTYREAIDLHDGSRLESTAKLTDHWD